MFSCFYGFSLLISFVDASTFSFDALISSGKPHLCSKTVFLRFGMPTVRFWEYFIDPLRILNGAEQRSTSTLACFVYSSGTLLAPGLHVFWTQGAFFLLDSYYYYPLLLNSGFFGLDLHLHSPGPELNMTLLPIRSCEDTPITIMKFEVVYLTITLPCTFPSSFSKCASEWGSFKTKSTCWTDLRTHFIPVTDIFKIQTHGNMHNAVKFHSCKYNSPVSDK